MMLYANWSLQAIEAEAKQPADCIHWLIGTEDKAGSGVK